MEKNAQVVLFRIFFSTSTTKKKNSIRNFLIEKRKKMKEEKLSFVHSRIFFVCTLLVRQKNIVFILKVCNFFPLFHYCFFILLKTKSFWLICIIYYYC